MITNDYHDVKICVYAITADESEEFIDRWLDSMSGADFISILVTKLNNPNYIYLQKKKELPQFQNKLIIAEKEITPWRFDVARNESIKLIPIDKCDVCICTDIDEILISDFWDDLRILVQQHPNFERIFYQYAWSHDDKTGEPKNFFWYDKIHKPIGWKWEFPVHETLRCDNIQELKYEGTYYLNSNKIYLHHYPDNNKSRGSYLSLLELRITENPNDYYGMFYLAREYTFYKDYINSAKTAFQLYTVLASRFYLENFILEDSVNMLSVICCLLGDSLIKLGMLQDSEFFYLRALFFDKTYKAAYMKLIQLYAYQGRAQDAKLALQDMNIYSVQINDWRIPQFFWRDWKKYQLYADIACAELDFQTALKYIKLAKKDIKSESDKIDATDELFYVDLKYIKEKNK